MLTALLMTGMTAVARDSNTTRPAAVSNDGQRVSLFEETLWAASGSPDKPRGLSIQPCKSEKEEPYIRHSSQGRSECLYLRIE